jgi:hypothetical protein
MRKTLTFLSSLLLLALPACGDAGTATEDNDTSNATPATEPTTSPTSGATDPTAGAAPTCADYCTAITANCAAPQAQYADMAGCMGSCAAFDIGTLADTAGNTVGCRTYHAGAAKDMMMPEVHCVHAGPGGAGPCGTNCEGFCDIALSACPAIYADAAACAADCATFMDTEPFDATDVAGNTLACRLYHLTVASSSADNAAIHCAHINAASPVCI